MNVSVVLLNSGPEIFNFAIGTGRPLPRKGETMTRNGKKYKVKKVVFRFVDTGKSGKISVILHVKPKWKSILF